MRPRTLLPLLLVTLAGCGSDEPATVVSGTIHQSGQSYSLDVKDAFFVRYQPATGPGGLIFYFSDRPGACAAFQANPSVQLKSSSSLLIAMADLVTISTSHPIVEGTYVVPASSSQTGLLSESIFRTVDASCTEQARAFSQTGSVTVTTAPGATSGGRAVGTFDLSMAHGSGEPVDRLTGRFDLPECVFDPASGGPSTCQ
jgi:hypothetical protein